MNNHANGGKWGPEELASLKFKSKGTEYLKNMSQIVDETVVFPNRAVTLHYAYHY